MARKEGTGGRGGMGTIDLDAFAPVEEDEELSRSRTAPSELQPLIDAARQNLGRKFEARDKVQATDPDTNEPLWETDENGEPIRDNDGNPVPVLTSVPHIYTKAEADEFAAQLRNVGNRNKLPARRLSLRIVADPPLAKAKDGDEVRVQFYIVGRAPSEGNGQG